MHPCQCHSISGPGSLPSWLSTSLPHHSLASGGGGEMESWAFGKWPRKLFFRQKLKLTRTYQVGSCQVKRSVFVLSKWIFFMESTSYKIPLPRITTTTSCTTRNSHYWPIVWLGTNNFKKCEFFHWKEKWHSNTIQESCSLYRKQFCPFLFIMGGDPPWASWLTTAVAVPHRNQR